MASHVILTAHWDWVLYHYRLPFARALRLKGYRVTLVCPDGHYLPKLEADGFPCVRWQISRKSLNPLREIISIIQLVGIYRRLKPDMVHHFTVKPNLYGTLAAHFAKVPVVLNTFTGLGYLFTDDFRTRALRFFLHPFLRWALNRPNAAVIFQSDSDRETLVKLKILNSDKRSVVIRGSGVDTGRFKRNGSPAFNSQVSKKPVVLMAARLLRDKGVKEFVEMARALKGQGVEADFWIAGAPDNGNPACLSDHDIQKWVSEGPVEFLGHRDDISEVLSHADIAVLPSHHEGVPLFLLEAAAAGLPLVATDIGGCKSIIQPNINGFLIPPKDSSALALAVSKLIQDPELRARMGRASREIATHEFDEQLIHKQFLKIYDETLTFA